MRRKASIFLVTYEGMPELTQDDQHVRTAIEEQGGNAKPVCWNDPRIDWREADIAVLRSTWDYLFTPQGFKDWVHLASSKTILVNTKELILWNIHKQYLLDLQACGIDIVPTSLIVQGSNAKRSLDLALERFGEDIVIKPAISCASNLTSLFRLSDPTEVANAAEHLNVVLRQTDALIQPLIIEVFGEGEHSLVFLDGRYSHTVAKEPFRQGITPTFAKETIPSTHEEISFCRKVLSKLRSMPMYARVDIMVCSPGPLLNELELIEPELHLHLAADSARTFASLIIKKCNGRL